MPHQCLKCNTVFDNSSDAIIKGCTVCGAKLFLFLKRDPQKAKEEEIELTKETKELIVKELESQVNIDEIDQPIILKLENVRILGPGKYEIDINQLMKKEKPLIYKVQEGTYVIDLKYLQGDKNGV